MLISFLIIAQGIYAKTKARVQINFHTSSEFLIPEILKEKNTKHKKKSRSKKCDESIHRQDFTIDYKP